MNGYLTLHPHCFGVKPNIPIHNIDGTEAGTPYLPWLVAVLSDG